MKIIGQEYAKDNWDKLVTWTCCLCGAGFAWAPRGKGVYYLSSQGACLDKEAFTFNRAPYVVTLADGKEHGFCSRGCVRTKALLVGLEALVRPQAGPATKPKSPYCSRCRRNTPADCAFTAARGNVVECPLFQPEPGKGTP